MDAVSYVTKSIPIPQSHIIVFQDDVMTPDRIAVQYAAAIASGSDVVSYIYSYVNCMILRVSFSNAEANRQLF